MSRIGRLPVAIPAGVEVTVAEGNVVTVKGPKGTLERALPTEMEIKVEDGHVVVSRPNDLKKMKSLHGLTRSLIHNMVVGVSEGYTKELEVNGVGYKAAKQGKKLVLSLGYSHPVEMEDPDGIETKVDGNKIIVSGISKEKVGQFTSDNFINILNTFTFVWLRSSLVSDLSSVLANFFFTDTFNDDLVLSIKNSLDALRIFHLYRMRVSQVQSKLFALLCSSVTNTVYLQNFLITLSYTVDHVVDQSSGQTM